MNKLAFSCDLLVIGGGINGAGIARDAAGRGLSVLLCEQNDFAGATSSASTKLIHGGLRYLEYYEFGLVAKALAEREHVLDIAPHICWPLRFVMPHVKGLRPRWMIRLGLWLYDHLGGRVSLPHSQSMRLDTMANPSGLKPEIKHGFAYSDAWVDDARLVILNLRSAQDHGAQVFARTRLASASRVNGAWHCMLENRQTLQWFSVSARAVVNAAGPWVAEVDQMLNPQRLAQAQGAHIKLVRGSHIVVPRLFAGEHAYILQNDDKRIIFMIPYEDNFTLIGTTEVAQQTMGRLVQITEQEEDYLLRAVNAYLDKPVERTDIVWRYSGVRPLFDDEADNPSAVTRDYKLVVNDAMNTPCISVYGGKITTYRLLAETVLDKLSPWVKPQRGAWTTDEALPGGAFARTQRAAQLARLQQAYAQLDAVFLRRLFARHGLLAYDILKDARSSADLGQDFGGGLTQREVDYLVEHEWACSADDILWRRTKCGLHMSAQQRAEFAVFFSAYKPSAPAPL